VHGDVIVPEPCAHLGEGATAVNLEGVFRELPCLIWRRGRKNKGACYSSRVVQFNYLGARIQ
jgi:hypothetical protein